MIPLTGAVIGVLFGLGAWMMVAGITGVAVRERAARHMDWARSWRRVGSVALAAAVAWFVTGWPMAGALAGGVATMVPLLLGARSARAAALDKTEALAAWAEMLRDTISAYAALNEAIAITATVAPEAIRPQVHALAARSERYPLSRALQMFAVDVADPVADLIVAALVIADQRQAQNLTLLLAEIAGSAREHAAMRLRVETGRARTYASSQALVGITLGLVVVLLLMSPTFLAPFDSFGGQVVMGIIGALFAGALWGLVLLGRPAETPRLLAGVQEAGSR